MALDKKYVDYGVLEVCSMGVKVYYTQTNYDYIYQNDVVDARWAGDCVLVTLKNGRRLRFTSKTTYQEIR